MVKSKAIYGKFTMVFTKNSVVALRSLGTLFFEVQMCTFLGWFAITVLYRLGKSVKRASDVLLTIVWMDSNV